MRLQPAEARAVLQKLRLGELLSPHDKHMAVEPGLIEPLPVAVGEGANVDARDKSADAWHRILNLHIAPQTRVL